MEDPPEIKVSARPEAAFTRGEDVFLAASDDRKVWMVAVKLDMAEEFINPAEGREILRAERSLSRLDATRYSELVVFPIAREAENASRRD